VGATKDDRDKSKISRKSGASSRSSNRRSPLRRKKRSGINVTWMLLSLCLGIALVITLYLYLRHLPPPFTQRVKATNDLLLSQFYQLDIPLKDIRKWGESQRQGEKTWTLTHWEIILPQGVKPEKVTSQLMQRIKETSQGVTITTAMAPDNAWGIELKVDDLLAHHLILRPPTLKPPKLKPPKPRIAIVVDDLGMDQNVAEELLSIDAPLTFSILPLYPFSHHIAQRAHAQGREVILHLPMEPRGYPLKKPGEGALFVSMSEKELLHQLREDLESVPFITGVNNHMGSRFMEHEEKVRVVLQELKERNLYFLDSLTTSKSKGHKVASEIDIKMIKRDIFLDNETKPKDIEHQFKKLFRIARSHGKAIGVCHPYPATIATIKQMIPKLEEGGIEIVPLSQFFD
jgi:polysaccharide deacetylase 2 family uncharacterized protein YibQ